MNIDPIPSAFEVTSERLELGGDVAELTAILEAHRLALELEPGYGGEPWLALAVTIDAHPRNRMPAAARGTGATAPDAIGDLLPRLRAWATTRQEPPA